MKWIITKAFDQTDPSSEPVEDVTDIFIGFHGVYEGSHVAGGFMPRENIADFCCGLPYVFRIYTRVGYLAYEGRADDCTSADATLPLAWFEKETIMAGYISYLQADNTWLQI